VPSPVSSQQHGVAGRNAGLEGADPLSPQATAVAAIADSSLRSGVLGVLGDAQQLQGLSCTSPAHPCEQHRGTGGGWPA